MRGEGVQGVLTLICSGVAQTFHDDRVVELKEQLVVEEVEGKDREEQVEAEREKRVKEGAPWMIWRWLRKDLTSPRVKECALCASSAHDVHHASVCVNVVIGVVLGGLHIVVHVIPLVVCDDAVVLIHFILIALIP